MGELRHFSQSVLLYCTGRSSEIGLYAIKWLAAQAAEPRQQGTITPRGGKTVVSN